MKNKETRNKDMMRYEGYYRKTGDKKFLAVAHAISHLHYCQCNNCTK